MSNKQLEVAFENIILVSEKFSRGMEIPEKMNFDFQFKLREQILPNNRGQLEILANVTGANEEKKSVFTLETHFAGIFMLKSDDDSVKIEFLKKKAPEFLFPYLREHISTITQKAGLRNIIIPLIDLASLAQSQEANKNKLKN